MSLDTPNSQKQKQSAELAADVERFLADGGEIKTTESGFRQITRGPDQTDHIRTPSAAALLGYPESAILQCYRTGALGGHPAPDFIRHRATKEPMFMREAVYQWIEKYGRSGSKGVPKTKGASQVLTVSEVAMRVGLSRPTIQKRMAAGNFPKNIVGTDRKNYWREKDIEKWESKQGEPA